MGDRIAVIHGNRVTAVFLTNAHQTPGRAIQCLAPGDLAPSRAFADQGSTDAIRIVVEIGEGTGFWTDVAAADRVVPVATDRPHVLTVSVDKNAARRFAEGTRGCQHYTSGVPEDLPEHPVGIGVVD